MKLLALYFDNQVIYPKEDALMKYNNDFFKANSKHGYCYTAGVYELPMWINVLSANIPLFMQYNKSFAVRIKEIPDYLTQDLTDMYDNSDVFISVTDANKRAVHKIINLCKDLEYCNFILGGYCNLDEFNNYEHVKTFTTMSEMYNYFKCPTQCFDINYTLFYSIINNKIEGKDKIIPRFKIIDGCTNRCRFCVADKSSYIYSEREIDNQIRALTDINYELVYINDLTLRDESLVKLKYIHDELSVSNKKFKGFIVQTTTNYIISSSKFKQFIKDYPNIIQVVEFGVETFNDKILDKYLKPSSEQSIKDALGLLTLYNIKAIPNIIVGLPEETKDTYLNTLNFLNDYKKWMFSINIYRYCNYQESSNLGQVELANKRNIDNEFEQYVIKIGESLWK